MNQRAEITFETEETVVLRNSGQFLRGFCPACRDEVHLFPPELLASITGSSEREVFRLLEAGRVDFVETRRIYACIGCYQKLLSA